MFEYDELIYCRTKCVKCGMYLGLQNSGDTCSTCDWLRYQAENMEKETKCV